MPVWLFSHFLSLSFTAMAADVKPGKAKTLQGSTLAIEVVDWFCYD